MIIMDKILKINLNELWTLGLHELPDWVWYENVIYRIHNLVNDKSYIGQAKVFIERLRLNRKSHYNSFVNGVDYIIYKAISKYTPSNFEVEILEYDCNDLNKSEIFYINKLNTYIHSDNSLGYNMTLGGDKPPSELGRKALLELYPETNGVPPNYIKSGREANIKLYPETNGASPQFIKAGKIEMNRLYGMNGMSPQCIESAHTSKANLNRSISRVFYALNRNLSILSEINSNLTVNDYISLGESIIGSNIYINIRSVLKYIDIMRSDKRWTEQMELIFSRLKLENNKIIIIKD